MGDPLIYSFGSGVTEGDAARRDVLGGKGASLVSMSAAGLPVPPGFTLAISCCRHYHDSAGQWPAGLDEQLRSAMNRLEQMTGQLFGEGARPLLVSVRSGAARSMPGMMDTILNCGLHPGLADVVPSEDRFWKVYAQFARQFTATVARVSPIELDRIARGVDTHTAPARALAEGYIRCYEERSGRLFPTTAWDALVECINAVFESWNNERARIYRKSHGLHDLLGTAVTVQSMFDSEVSGIAFTANPSQPQADELILEASFGLGEAVVSGEVTPDRFVLDRNTLAIKQRVVGRKDQVTATLSRDTPTISDPQAASLTDGQIQQVARMAMEVEKLYAHPVDVEWGLRDGRVALLQARPIRGLDVARDTEAGRQEEIARLKQLTAAERSNGRKGKNAGKVWIVHNLAETLEAPTPLTWDIMLGFMSGDGGYGAMYRDLGYRPSRLVREQGFLELICGRIYCDIDRAAQLFWEGLPVRYDHQAVLANTRILEAAPSQFDATRADGMFLIRLPGTIWAMMRASGKTRRARREARSAFEQKVLPPYRQYVDTERARDLTKLSIGQLVDALQSRIAAVLNDFGKESLKPGFFGGCARAELEARLIQLLGPVDGGILCQTLTSGLSGDSTVEQNSMLYAVARGEAKLDDFLAQYGHRAVGEMELARPRWREDASYLHQIIGSQAARPTASPASLHKTNEARRLQAMNDLPRTLESAGGSFLREEITALAVECQTLLPYREIGKHFLLMGYELIRMAIAELARRWSIGDDIFYLRLDEFDRYEAESAALAEEIARRKIRWQSAQRLDLPDVIDSADVDALGLPRRLQAAREFQGLALSPGVVSGTARVVHSPDEARDLGDDCILICPSTDPGWTALFITIKGLIVERGGVLSHGAITARDFSIPAVACPDATALIANGARLRVDGDRGQIAIVEDAAHA